MKIKNLKSDFILEISKKYPGISNPYHLTENNRYSVEGDVCYLIDDIIQYEILDIILIEIESRSRE